MAERESIFVYIYNITFILYVFYCNVVDVIWF